MSGLALGSLILLFALVVLAVIFGIIGINTRHDAVNKDYLERVNNETAKIKELLQEKDKLKKEVEQFCHEKYNESRKYIYEKQRAEEAKVTTERLLQAEHERAAAELGRVKEVEEEKLKHEFELKRIDLNKQFAEYKTELENNFSELSKHYATELANITLELEEYQAKRAAINEAILRERELEEKEDFYRISIKENDTKDIEVLRSIEPRLTNREILNKLIYEVFIKRPLMEMEKRVLQGRKIGGIYKITYIKTGESYIGRSVDIGNRWKEHCLSSLNIGTIAHSTFHNVLADKGLQNFTWEVLEEVEKDKQSSREKYWIEFYHTDKQFNSKAGG